MNEFNLAGRVFGNLEIKTAESGNNYGQMIISVKRPFKTKDGEFEYDQIQVTMFKSCIEEAKEIVKDGVALLVKGHISSSSYSKDDKTYYTSSIIADRISLINHLL